MKTLGRHILVELYECDRSILDDTRKVRDAMVDAAKAARCHVVKDVFHRFNPHGVSGVVVISESHLAIHTWPEFGYAAVDLFTCGNEGDPWVAYEFLARELRAGRVSAMEMRRGILPEEAPATAPAARPVPAHQREERVKVPVLATHARPRGLRVAAGAHA